MKTLYVVVQHSRLVWITSLAEIFRRGYSFAMYPYATSTCVAIDASTSQCVYVSSTSTPQYFQDAGNLSYVMGWIVFFLAMIFLGMVWNALPFNRGI